IRIPIFRIHISQAPDGCVHDTDGVMLERFKPEHALLAVEPLQTEQDLVRNLMLEYYVPQLAGW
ncbi:MAG: hypothetical protein ABI444_10795, partial [Candidatus Kapaibacterium sp.]